MVFLFITKTFHLLIRGIKLANNTFQIISGQKIYVLFQTLTGDSTGFFSNVSSTFTKLFPLLSGIVHAPHIIQIRPTTEYKMHKPGIPTTFFNSGNNFTEVHPDNSKPDCVIPIENVLISVGYNSFISGCNTGNIPADLIITSAKTYFKRLNLHSISKHLYDLYKGSSINHVDSFLDYFTK